MKLQNLLQIKAILEKHAQEPMPTLSAYKIMKFLKESSEEVAFYKERIKALSEKYGDKNENGELAYDEDGNLRVAQDKLQDCKKELNDLAFLEVKEPALKFSVGDFKTLNLSVSELFALDEVIKEGE